MCDVRTMKNLAYLSARHETPTAARLTMRRDRDRGVEPLGSSLPK
jgi:hypothetical protein